MAAVFIVTLPLLTLFFFKQKLKALGLHSQGLNYFMTDCSE